MPNPVETIFQMDPTGSESTGVPVFHVQVLQRLQQKRISLDKELSKIPGAPTSGKDVFHLCRGFERAFSFTVEVIGQVCTGMLFQGCSFVAVGPHSNSQLLHF